MIRRLVWGGVTIWLAMTMAFFALRALPGNAIRSQLVASGASENVIAERVHELGLDDSVLAQYLRFLGGVLQGDLGNSLLDGQPVTAMILGQLVPTVTLAIGSLMAAVVLGIGLGTVAGLDLRWGVSRLAKVLIHLALSVPIYWSGTLVIYLFTAKLGLLPPAGSGRVSQLVMPVMILGFHSAGAIGRVVQANIWETARSDFVRTARAKGLSEFAVVWRHMLRAGLPPVVSVIALQAGFLFSGAVITESLFVRPGLGRMLLDGTLRQDYSVVQGIVIFAAIVYTGFSLAADVVYGMLDPRVRQV